MERPVLSFDDKRGSQGSQLFVAPNPDFGAVFTYYLKEEFKSLKKERQEKEKNIKGNIPFPGWESLDNETRAEEPMVVLEVKDRDGNVINRVVADNKKGFNRVAWNLRVGGATSLTLDGDVEELEGLLAAPGTYSASLYLVDQGEVSPLAGPVSVSVERLYDGSLPGNPMEVVTDFWRGYEEMSRDVSTLQVKLSNAHKMNNKLKIAAMKANVESNVLQEIAGVKKELDALDTRFNGNAAKNEIGEKSRPTLNDRLFALNRGISRSTYGPTQTHRQTMEIIRSELTDMQENLTSQINTIKAIGKKVVEAGGSWVEGL